MTEIPEHLLKRSQAAKAKAGGADAPADAPASATTPAVPAVAAPAAAAKATAPAPVKKAPEVKPDIPVVTAYKTRKKIPMWAMAGLSILPVWGFMYVRALTPQEVEAVGPIGEGEQIYTVCAACHGADGGGGAGRQLSNGEVIKTFPHIEDQLRFVALGTDAYVAAGVDSYGNPDREGGPHLSKSFGIMPAASAGLGLSDVEILNSVCYIRYEFGELEKGEEYEKWCSEGSEIHAALASGANTFANLHETFPDIITIGDVPLAGSPPSE